MPCRSDGLKMSSSTFTLILVLEAHLIGSLLSTPVHKPLQPISISTNDSSINPNQTFTPNQIADEQYFKNVKWNESVSDELLVLIESNDLNSGILNNSLLTVDPDITSNNTEIGLDDSDGVTHPEAMGEFDVKASEINASKLQEIPSNINFQGRKKNRALKKKN